MIVVIRVLLSLGAVAMAWTVLRLIGPLLGIGAPVFERKHHQLLQSHARRDALLAANGLLLCVLGAVGLARAPAAVAAVSSPLGPLVLFEGQTAPQNLEIENLTLAPFVSGRDCVKRLPLGTAADESDWHDWELRWKSDLDKVRSTIETIRRNGSILAIIVAVGHDLRALSQVSERIYRSNQTLAYVRANCTARVIDEHMKSTGQSTVPILAIPLGSATVPDAVSDVAGPKVVDLDVPADRAASVYVWWRRNSGIPAPLQPQQRSSR